MIIGDTGIGKTTYALKIASCLLLGKKIPGIPFENKGKAKKILFLSSQVEVTRKKITALLKLFKVPKETRRRWRKHNILEWRGVSELDYIEKEILNNKNINGYDFIIIDSIARLVTNENEPQEVSALLYVRLNFIIASSKNKPCIIITHPAKDNRPRGHKIFAEWPRTTLLLKGDTKIKEIEIVPIKATEIESMWEPKHKWTIPRFKKIDKKRQYRLTPEEVQRELEDIGTFVTQKDLLPLLVKKYNIKKSTAELNIDYALNKKLIIKDPKKGLKSK
jgi:hypothetical protein